MRRFLAEILRYVAPLAIFATGVAIAATVAWRKKPESKDDAGDRRPFVETTSVSPHEGGLRIEVDGLVVPYREVITSAEVGGRIVEKSPQCETGMFVQEGEPLLAIDPEDYQLEWDRLKIELKQAQFNLQEVNDEVESTQQLIELAKRDLELRRTQHARLVAARERNASISSQQVDEAEQSVIAAHNSLLTLDSQLDRARIRASGLEQAIEVNIVRQKQAKRDLDRTKIAAPVSGVIIREDAEKDSYVRMGDPLFVMEDTSAVEVRCNLKMDELRWVWNQAEVDPSPISPPHLPSGDRPAQDEAAAESVYQYRLPPTPVEIRYELGGIVYMWDGVLARYDGIGLDERTRTVPCLIIVEKPKKVRLADATSPQGEGPRALVRGMFVTAIIKTNPKATLLKLPDDAVQPGNVVWRLDDGKLERVKIAVAQTIDETVIVDGGASQLSPGDRIVTSPLSVAYTGMEVRERANSGGAETASDAGSAGASPSQLGAMPSQAEGAP